MAGPVDTTPVAQGKRKRSQKEKTPVSQGTKRVKSEHEAVNGDGGEINGEATPVPEKQKDSSVASLVAKSKAGAPEIAKKNGSLETPSKKAVNGEDAAVGEKPKRLRRPARKERARPAVVAPTVLKEAAAVADSKSLWSVSRPSGGRFIAHDPIVSADDSCVFASNGREVQVLSVATSLVERTLPGPDSSVTAFALSPSDPETIYIASLSRRVQCWDWTTGTAVNDPIKYNGRIHALCAAVSDGGSADDLLYAICQVDGEWQILAGDRVVYTSAERLTHLSLDASYVMAASATKLIVGKRAAPETEAGEEAHFTFIEIDSPIEITSLAGRAQAVEASKKKTGLDVLTVAAGNIEGQIMVYEDVFATTRPSTIILAPRILHWHREVVAALKWSRDGNYLISGGRETTLVLWQLATGKKQFLPHLTAEIERLTVSASGTSYAVQLADNSVMVLSTTELKPNANFAGLQSQIAIQSDSSKRINPVAAVIHPVHNDQLLLSVPTSQAASSRPFLQTFDITNDRHVSRQALTRNNVTDFNKGPEGNKIKVPDVAFIKISTDGQWLATAEEWCPPVADVDFLSSESARAEQRNLRREVYLKIWRWDAERDVWALETRIDNPHQLADGAQPGRLLGLVADPVELGFATVGEDSSVRIWKPKTRLRNGLVVRGASAEGLVDWSCRHTVQLDRTFELTEDDISAPGGISRPKSAAFAYSEDGSMLAASQVFDATSMPPVVHFINTASGAVEQTRPNLYSGSAKAVDFLDRHLIIVSDTSIHLWDVVTESLVYQTGLAADAAISTTLLTVNREDRTFALSMASASASRVRVYNTSSPQPEFARNVDKAVSALLTVPGRKGYTMLTSNAEVLTLTSKSAAINLPEIGASSAVVATAEVLDEAGEEDEDADIDMGDKEQMLAIDEEEVDKPIVRPEQLAHVFEGENVALIPVREMFNLVVGLYARKPRGVVAA